MHSVYCIIIVIIYRSVRLHRVHIIIMSFCTPVKTLTIKPMQNGMIIYNIKCIYVVPRLWRLKLGVITTRRGHRRNGIPILIIRCVAPREYRTAATDAVSDLIILYNMSVEFIQSSAVCSHNNNYYIHRPVVTNDTDFEYYL